MKTVGKGKKVAIIQSNYIPWKGYFDIINMVDEFVIYDDAQYTKRDWRNRNIIKTKDGLKWLTIPVKVKGKYNQSIRETKIANKKWPEKHWKAIKNNYNTSAYFKEYEEVFEKIYLQCKDIEALSVINKLFINLINSILGINTNLTDSTEFHFTGTSSEKIISLCKQLGAEIYVSGPAAKDYLTDELFLKEGISILWMNYSGYPEYNQMFSPFEHRVSILDLIFNEGEKAPMYMKSFT
jgi:hypothetical protein